MSTDLPQPHVTGHSTLTVTDRVFRFLSNAPAGLSLDGRTLSPALPQRQLPLMELRDLLATPTMTTAVRDAVWRELVTRAQWEGPQWRVAAVGMAVPTLRRICGRLCLYVSTRRSGLIEDAVVSAFIRQVKDVSLDQPDILPSLFIAARRAGERTLHQAEAGIAGHMPCHEPNPVLVLAEAVGIDIADSLIEQTRRSCDDTDPPETAATPRQRSLVADAVLAAEVERTRSLTSSTPRTGPQDDLMTSARGRITSDPKPITTSSKGGRGSPTGSARIHLFLRRHRRLRLLRCLLVAVLVAVVLATIAVAAIAEPPAVMEAAPPKNLNAVFDNLRNWLIGMLAALATLMLTIGGLRYLVAGGDPGEVQKAKGALKAAAFGYGLAVLAPLFVTVLKGIVGGG